MTSGGRRRSGTDRSSTADDRSQPADQQVRNRAYEIYEERGGEHGHEWEDWLRAEREMRPKRKDE